jgi:hypothetical protein
MLISQMKSSHSEVTAARAGIDWSVEPMSDFMPGMMKSARSTRSARKERRMEESACGIDGMGRKGVHEMKTMKPSKMAQLLHQ